MVSSGITHDIKITREEAIQLLRENIGNINLQNHCLATEVIMRKLAEEREEDQNLWGITGLLHDLDFELTGNNFSNHGLKTSEMLAGYLPEEALHAIKSHNGENNGFTRKSDFDHLLAAGEALTGLIVATALVYPDRKLQKVKPSSVLKRMNKSGFARSVSRDNIKECKIAGYQLEEFIGLALEAMKGISDQLGL